MNIHQQNLASAKSPEQLFGKDADVHYVRMYYKTLAAATHPDKGGDPDLFIKATKFHDAAIASLEAGTYGTKRAKLVDPIRVVTKRHAYMVREPIRSDALSDFFRADYKIDETTYQDVVLRVVRNKKNADLITNEAKYLKKILSDKAVSDLVAPYLPAYIESFGYRVGKEKNIRQTNVFSKPEYELFSLQTVIDSGKVIHAKDMAWMFRRILFGLGLIHSAGVIHGAVTPANILIQPEMHGMVIQDWTCAVDQGAQIKVVQPPYRDMYPSEVMNKEAAVNGTDLHMAVECMRAITTDMPKRLSIFFRGCQQANKNRRPQDAHKLMDEFDELIEDMWGRKTFRPFSMAVN